MSPGPGQHLNFSWSEIFIHTTVVLWSPQLARDEKSSTVPNLELGQGAMGTMDLLKFCYESFHLFLAFATKCLALKTSIFAASIPRLVLKKKALLETDLAAVTTRVAGHPCRATGLLGWPRHFWGEIHRKFLTPCNLTPRKIRCFTNPSTYVTVVSSSAVFSINITRKSHPFLVKSPWKFRLKPMKIPMENPTKIPWWNPWVSDAEFLTHSDDRPKSQVPNWITKHVTLSWRRPEFTSRFHHENADFFTQQIQSLTKKIPDFIRKRNWMFYDFIYIYIYTYICNC